MKKNQYNLLFATVLIVYLLYAGAFIYKTSALVQRQTGKYWVTEDRRYFVLFDDTMVSMRFARNLAHGEGLVWNPAGERVEGFTNPLWVGYMALVHLIEHDTARTSLYIQVTAAVLLAINLWVVRKIGDCVLGNTWAVLGSIIFTAFYLPLNTWSLQGNEVSLLTLLFTLAIWLQLRSMQSQHFSMWPYAVLGFSTLVRMDMAVSVGMLTTFMVFANRRRWKMHILTALVSLAAFIIPQIAFRLWYYDEWLPNTYYLKMQGYPLVLRVLHGLDVTLRVFIKVGTLPFLVFIFRRDRPARLLAWMFLGQVIFSVYVGGDAWEWYGGANRYISMSMPLFFVLLCSTLNEIYRLLSWSTHAHKPVARGGIIAFTLFLLVTMNATYGPGALGEWLLLKPSMDSWYNDKKVEQALWLRRYTYPNAHIALSGAGIVPYFANRPYIDMLGKNDKVIARLPMDRIIMPEFKPGHMKWDYAYSIGKLQPDVVMELWIDEPSAGPYLNAPNEQGWPSYIPIWSDPHKHMVWFRRGSTAVRWSLLGLPEGG